MKATAAEIQTVLKILDETPRRLLARTSGLPDADLHISPDVKSWSASDILAHLRSCADVWTHSIYAMLAEENPVLPDINERKWAKTTRYAELPYVESLQSFSLQRTNLLRVLKDLPFDSWERSALIFERKHTVFTQTRRMAKHELEHAQQIDELGKK